MTYFSVKLKDNVGRVYDCLVGWSETERRYHVRCVRDQWSTYVEPERVTGPTSARNVAFEAIQGQGIEGVEREGVHDAAM